MTISILYVDDDTDYHIIVSKFFKREADLSVTFCSTAHAALDLLEHELFDVIVSDYLMPVMDGIFTFEGNCGRDMEDFHSHSFTGRG